MENEFNLEELEDLDLDSDTHYEVWAVGYDVNDKLTEFDYLLDSFSDPDAAITFADSVSSKEILEVEGDALVKADHFSIEVETTSIVDDEPMNLGTIYKRSIYYNSITADLMISSMDYEAQDDGSLLIINRFLVKHKDKESINILFLDGDTNPILPIKIIEEIDATTFKCEILI